VREAENARSDDGEIRGLRGHERRGYRIWESRASIGEAAGCVVRIRYEITLDSTDDEAIYFRILLSDDASREERRREVTKRVESELSKRLKMVAAPRRLAMSMRPPQPSESGT
jgi:hypothetical protein